MQPGLEQQIVIADVDFEAYLEYHADQRREWIDGIVVEMAPVGLRHEEERDYLRLLFQAYFALNPIGRVLGEPFVMKLPEKRRGREPDLFVILNENPYALHETYLDGPADIVIEIVSPGAQRTDRGDKFDEYEAGGVREYWIRDPARKDMRFYRLNTEGVYIRIAEDSNGDYMTPLLPRLMTHVPSLWLPALPNVFEITQVVRKMWET